MEALDALLVTKLVNIRYLSGFTGSAGGLLVGAGKDVLATDGRYLEQAAEEAPDVELLDGRGLEWVGKRLEAGTRLGVESHSLTWEEGLALSAALPEIEVIPAPRHVETLRQRKDDTELALIARACTATDAAFAALLGWLAPGFTEREVARQLADELLKAGADDPAFSPYIAGGSNGARPHHQGGHRRLQRGDLVTLDFGACVDGYGSDMTRTVALGEPAHELRAVYDVVREAQTAGIETVADGVEAGTADAACREVIVAAGYGKAFVHGTGHGLGLEVHEEPILRAGATARLADRMTVTVEPGVYLPGLGGVRIEDTVAVTRAAPATILTRSSKDLVIL